MELGRLLGWGQTQTDIGTGLHREQGKSLVDALAPATNVPEKATDTLKGVSEIPEDYRLDPALETAYQRAAEHMNTLLRRDHMEVEVVAGENGERIARVHDLENGKIIKEYDGLEMLRFYAENNATPSVVIDGKI